MYKMFREGNFYFYLKKKNQFSLFNFFKNRIYFGKFVNTPKNSMGSTVKCHGPVVWAI